MKHETLIYVVIGSAIVGVAYYLWKQEQAAPAASASTSTSGAVLGGLLGGIVGGLGGAVSGLGLGSAAANDY